MTQSPESGGSGPGRSTLSCCSVPTFVPCSEPLEPPWDHLHSQAPFTFPFVLLESSTWYCQGLRPGPGTTRHPCDSPLQALPREGLPLWALEQQVRCLCGVPPSLDSPQTPSPRPPSRPPGLVPSSHVCWVPRRQGRWAGVPPSPDWRPPQPWAGLWGGPAGLLSTLPAHSCRASFLCSWGLEPWEVCLVPPGILGFVSLGRAHPPPVEQHLQSSWASSLIPTDLSESLALLQRKPLFLPLSLSSSETHFTSIIYFDVCFSWPPQILLQE